MFFIIENISRSQEAHDDSTDSLTALSIIPSSEHRIFGDFVKATGTRIHHIHFAMRTVAQLINSLHGLGLCHGDLSSRHINVTRHNEVSTKYYCLHYVMEIYRLDTMRSVPSIFAYIVSWRSIV